MILSRTERSKQSRDKRGHEKMIVVVALWRLIRLDLVFVFFQGNIFSFPTLSMWMLSNAKIIIWTFLLALLICAFILSGMFLLLNMLIYVLLRFIRRGEQCQNSVNGQPCIQVLQTHLWNTCTEVAKMPVKYDFLAWAFVHLLDWISNSTHSDVRLFQLKTVLC